jgi:hypothetical protein
MRTWKILLHLMLILLLSIGVSGVVSAKVASGDQNLVWTGYQGETVFNWLTCQGKSDRSTTGPPECSVVPRGAGSAADAAAGAKLNRELMLDEVVDHSFYKHVLQQGEFKGLGIRTKTQFREHVNNVIENPSSIRYYKDGRSAYLQESTGTVVIRNPTGSGQSTAFQPRSWNDYINNVLPSRTTPYQ